MMKRAEQNQGMHAPCIDPVILIVFFVWVHTIMHDLVQQMPIVFKLAGSQFSEQF